MKENKSPRLDAELESFSRVWKGGYYEGDIFDYHAYSSYGLQSYMSILHAVYLSLIKPYIKGDTNVIEIGPGRGTFTKGMLNANSIHCLDALSAEYNQFWEFIGQHDHVKYFHVNDFSCKDLKEDYYDYLFSFGALCHVSFEGISLYAKNLYSKLKPGANCFILVADYMKHNASLDALEKDNILKRIPFQKIQRINYFLFKLVNRKKLAYRRNCNEDLNPEPGRWYNAGIEQTCKLLEDCGYKIIDPDVGLLLRDPIIHFMKPE